MQKPLDAGLALPAYDQCMKASHLFNLPDARGLSLYRKDRPILAGCVIAKGCCETWVDKPEKV